MTTETARTASVTGPDRFEPDARRGSGDAPISTVRRAAWVSILVALLLPMGAYLLQSLLWETMSPFAWFLFYPAIFAAAWMGGFASGLAATLLSAVLVWWSFVPPEGTFVKQDLSY